MMMLGFTLFTYFKFGDLLDSFSSFNASFFSSYLLMLGDEKLLDKMVVVSPGFFLMFYFVLMFIFKLGVTFLIFCIVVFEYNSQRLANKTVKKDDF